MREDVKMSRCERRCEDEKMFYRPPLLEEPCAQMLSGIRCGSKMVKVKLEGSQNHGISICPILTCL